MKGQSAPSRAQISALAYQYYVERGWRHGKDVEDWLHAEAVLRHPRTPAAIRKAAATESASTPQVAPTRGETGYPLVATWRGTADRQEAVTP